MLLRLQLAGTRAVAAAVPRAGWRPGWASARASPASPAVGRRRAGEEAAAGAGDLAGRRRQPARDLGPQAEDRHRRPVPVDRDHACRACRSPSCLPHTAKQMHRLALLRSINTNENDHGKGDVPDAHRPAPDAGDGLPAPRLGHGQVAARTRQPAARLHPHHARRRRQGVERGGLPRAQVQPAVPRQRPGPGQHRADPAVSALGAVGPAGAADAHRATASPAAAGPPRPRPTPPPTTRPAS